jgi:hypothetical protein
MRVPVLAACLLFALMACSPRLDWREVRPPGAGVLALFPCKPDIESREQGPARMGLAACKAAGLGFSLTWAQLDDPALVGPALQQMRESLAVRLKASPALAQAVQISGMTPNPQALQQSLRAAQLQAEVAVFAHGLRVYQAVMLGPESDPAAWETFLGGVKLEP